jgi:hypothetical protein
MSTIVITLVALTVLLIRVARRRPAARLAAALAASRVPLLAFSVEVGTGVVTVAGTVHDEVPLADARTRVERALARCGCTELKVIRLQHA